MIHKYYPLNSSFKFYLGKSHDLNFLFHLRIRFNRKNKIEIILNRTAYFLYSDRNIQETYERLFPLPVQFVRPF